MRRGMRRGNVAAIIVQQKSICNYPAGLLFVSERVLKKSNLPERFSMDLHKFIPGSLATLRARLNSLFFKNRANGSATHAMNSLNTE